MMNNYIRVAGISIHALVKRATAHFIPTYRKTDDFNPRPRKEGDSAPPQAQFAQNFISIHALVKRATEQHTA